MDYNEEVIDLCIKVFESVGMKRLSSRLRDWKDLPNNDNLDKLIQESILWMGFEKDIKKRNFVFGNSFSLLKGFIISQEKDYNKDGEPVIIINKLADDSASFKDNPIKNLYVVYENEETRDIDFERLLLARG